MSYKYGVDMSPIAIVSSDAKKHLLCYTCNIFQSITGRLHKCIHNLAHCVF